MEVVERRNLLAEEARTDVYNLYYGGLEAAGKFNLRLTLIFAALNLKFTLITLITWNALNCPKELCRWIDSI